MSETKGSKPPTVPVSGDPVPIKGTGAGENAPVATKPKAILYFKTKPGIFKIVSVVLGLIALPLIAYGYMKAELFRKIGNTTNYRDDICRKRNSELGEHHKANETVVCPSRWMVIPQLYLIGIVWSATFIFLILLTFLNLTKNRLFFKADFLGHIFAGVITTLSGLCVLSYFMQVIIEDMCNETNLRREVEHWKNANSSDFKATLTKMKRKCPEIQRNTYFHWYFLPGGILAFATGIMYIAIAIGIIMQGVATGMFKKEVTGPISLVPTQATVQKDKQEDSSPAPEN